MHNAAVVLIYVDFLIRQCRYCLFANTCNCNIVIVFSNCYLEAGSKLRNKIFRHIVKTNNVIISIILKICLPLRTEVSYIGQAFPMKFV